MAHHWPPPATPILVPTLITIADSPNMNGSNAAPVVAIALPPIATELLTTFTIFAFLW